MKKVIIHAPAVLLGLISVGSMHDVLLGGCPPMFFWAGLIGFFVSVGSLTLRNN